MILQKPLKTTHKTVVEACNLITDPTLYPRLLLTGCDQACNNIQKYQQVNPHYTCECNSFLSNIGEGYTFYYELLHYNKSDLLISEVGLAEFEILEGKQYINRLYCLFHQHGNDATPNPHFYNVRAQGLDEYIHIYVYRVSNALQLFIEENTIPYTSSNGPTALRTSTNSVIGRLNDGIENISLDSLFSLESFTKGVVKTLKDFKNQLILKTSKLYTKTLELNKLTFASTEKPSKPDAGDVVFDITDNVLKYYNGSEWVNLK